MLKEVPKEIVLQKKGESNLRWFRDNYFDLFIWYDDFLSIISFHIYYDIYHDQKALFWDISSGFSHHIVDDGIRPGKNKATPIVIKDGTLNRDELLEKFKERSGNIENELSSFIVDKIEAVKMNP